MGRGARPSSDSRPRRNWIRAETVAAITLTMADPLGRGLVWPQRSRWPSAIPTAIKSSRWTPAGASTVGRRRREACRRPLYVLPNGAGLGYGLFLLDDREPGLSAGSYRGRPDRADARLRVGYVVGQPARIAHLTAPPFSTRPPVRCPSRPTSRTPSGCSAICRATFWRFLPPDERAARSASFENLLRAGSSALRRTSQKAAWFNTYRDTAQSSRRADLAGTRVATRGARARSAARRAGRDRPGPRARRSRGAQAGRRFCERSTTGRKTPIERLDLRSSCPRCRPTAAEREKAFERLRDRGEPSPRAVGVESLRYLNHPLGSQAERFDSAPSARSAPRDSADGRHLLSDTLDGVDARRAPLSRGSGDRPSVSCRESTVPRALAMDDARWRPMSCSAPPGEASEP